MDKNSIYVMNDLIDIVTVLTSALRELNPGQNFDFVDFLIARSKRVVDENYDELEKSRTG